MIRHSDTATAKCTLVLSNVGDGLRLLCCGCTSIVNKQDHNELSSLPIPFPFPLTSKNTRERRPQTHYPGPILGLEEGNIALAETFIEVSHTPTTSTSWVYIGLGPES